MKLYFEAEKFLRPGTGSLQSRVFNDKSLKSSPKHVFALCYLTLKYKDYIQAIISKAQIRKQLPKFLQELLWLVVHDLLFSTLGRIQLGKHPLKDSFLKHRARLHAELVKLKLKYKVKNIRELPTQAVDEDETPVRWFRVNPILSTEEKVTSSAWFSKLTPVEDLSEIISHNLAGFVYKDTYIPNLYAVSVSERITNTESYKKGHIIIQDRASCFPAHILHEDSSDVHTCVIDGCAAPGNKTTHLAAHMNEPDSVVFAFERDAKRVQVLKKMCGIALPPKSELIQVTHADFTTTKPHDFPDATGFVLDPSCSGLGIFGRVVEDGAGEEEEGKLNADEERLTKLASFQCAIVKHAMKFPRARKIVYSTCLIHPHENERVVLDVLLDEAVRKQGWRLEKREHVLPLWPRRGWESEFLQYAGGDEDQSKVLAGGCVRAMPRTDGGIGFFAACFVRDTVEGL